MTVTLNGIGTGMGLKVKAGDLQLSTDGLRASQDEAPNGSDVALFLHTSGKELLFVLRWLASLLCLLVQLG